jgi:hypothetical protein
MRFYLHLFDNGDLKEKYKSMRFQSFRQNLIRDIISEQKNHILLEVLRFLLILFVGIPKLFSQNATTVYNKISISTVTIETNEGSLGSGFFIQDNIIVTNYHVIEGGTDAFCFLNNSNIAYKVDGYLAVDKNSDLILLKVSTLNRPAIKFSTSNEVIGQNVYVIGSPKGLPGTISDGIISAYREIEGNRLIQMTAPISSGSSGGPVLNSSGELIGISVSQIVSGQNLNFAIPKSNLKALLNYKSDYPKSLESLIIKLKVGQTYAGGIIFYIDETGKHGKVISKNDLIFNGKHYMSWQNAFYCCSAFSEDGYSDWYLPQKSDLELVLLNRNFIPGFKDKKISYWTSTGNNEKAWSFTFNPAYVHFYSPKSSGYNVRAIRDF